MEDLNYLSRLDKVEAPPDFDERVRSRLELWRQSRRRQRVLGLSLAGATAAFLVCLGLLNVLVVRQDEPAEMAGLVRGRTAAKSTEMSVPAFEENIPVLETLDYFDKTRKVAAGPETIYLLEQISYTPQRGIRY